MKYRSQFKWKDNKHIKLNEIKIEVIEESADYYNYQNTQQVIQLYAVKEFPESDEIVLNRLILNAKAKKRRDDKASTNKKRELTLLKKLKEKYGEDA